MHLTPGLAHSRHLVILSLTLLRKVTGPALKANDPSRHGNSTSQVPPHSRPSVTVRCLLWRDPCPPTTYTLALRGLDFWGSAQST